MNFIIIIIMKGKKQQRTRDTEQYVFKYGMENE